MVGLREQKKIETRKAIIAAAVGLFSDKGFTRTSIEDIAKNAGIGKATVYTYFATKSDIFLTYCDDEMEEAFAHIRMQKMSGVKLIDQLVDFFILKFRFITDNREFGRQLLQEMLFPQSADNKAREHDQRYFDFLEDLFVAAQERGELSAQQDLFLLSAHFFSLYLGILVGWYGGYFDDEAAVVEGMRSLFNQVFEGIGT